MASYVIWITFLLITLSHCFLTSWFVDSLLFFFFFLMPLQQKLDSLAAILISKIVNSNICLSWKKNLTSLIKRKIIKNFSFSSGHRVHGLFFCQSFLRVLSRKKFIGHSSVSNLNYLALHSKNTVEESVYFCALLYIVRNKGYFSSIINAKSKP